MSVNEAEMVAAVVAGGTLGEVAAAAGTSVSTVQRRLKEPEIIAQVHEARSQHRQEALGRLTSLRSRALERLQDLLEDDDTSLVLRAATLVLSTATKFDLVADLDERVAALELHSISVGNLEPQMQDNDDPRA